MRHEIEVRCGAAYRAFCSCGWIGRSGFSTAAAAERDGDEHVLAIIQPDDALDPEDHDYERKNDK